MRTGTEMTIHFRGTCTVLAWTQDEPATEEQAGDMELLGSSGCLYLAHVRLGAGICRVSRHGSSSREAGTR